MEAVVAALLVLPAGSLACGLTAARLRRLDALVPVQPDEPLEFLLSGRAGSVSLDGCTLHFGAFATVALPAGIPATSGARTIIDLLPQLSFGDGVALVEAALRGGTAAATVLDFASWRSESVLESHARVLWATAGLPVPIQQAEVRLEGARSSGESTSSGHSNGSSSKSMGWGSMPSPASSNGRRRDRTD